MLKEIPKSKVNEKVVEEIYHEGKCFVDSSIFYHVIVKNRVDLLRKLSKFILFISTNVLGEVSYKIVIDSILEEKNSKIHVLNFIASKINVISPTFDDFNLEKRFINKYMLLSNDALILAIALRNGKNKLATFDSDFKKAKDLIEILDENYFK